MVGFIAGVLTDRLDRKRLMLLANILRGIAVLILATLIWIHTSEDIVLAVASFAALTLGTGQVFFGIASNAAIVQIVGVNQAGEAVATLQTTQNLAGMIGPALAGQSIGIFGPAPAFLIDGFSYFLSSAGLLRIKKPFQTTREKLESSNFKRELFEGIHFLWSNVILRSLSISWFAINLLNAGTGILLAYYLLHDLGHHPQDIGYVFALWSAGGAAGSWVMAYIRRRMYAQKRRTFHTGRFMVTAVLIAGVCYFAMAFTTNTLVIGGLVGCSFGALLAATANSIALRQAITPDELLGRVMSVARVLAWGANPLGQLLTGGVLIVLSGRVTILIIGLATVLVGVVMLSSPLRNA
jgi:MFS family permease